MDKNLFCGKRIDTGELIKGYLWRDENHSYIIPSASIILNDGKPGGITAIPYEVIPETVSQSTGRCDIHGKDLFENALVSFERFLDKYVGRVVFNPKTCGFEIWYNTVVGEYGETAIHKMNFANIENLEVVGYTFDMPTL